MTVSDRRERERIKRRNDIIDSAERIFFSKGFEHATMMAVADSAELSKGTLYLYFQNKDELCQAIILRGLNKIRNVFLKISRSDHTGIMKILDIAERYIEFSQKEPDYYKALLKFRNFLQDSQQNGDIYISCRNENKKIIDIIATIINSGIEDGSIRNEINAERFALAIWGEYTGTLPGLILNSNSTDPGKGRSHEEVVLYMFQLLQDALKK